MMHSSTTWLDIYDLTLSDIIHLNIISMIRPVDFCCNMGYTAEYFYWENQPRLFDPISDQ